MASLNLDILSTGPSPDRTMCDMGRVEGQPNRRQSDLHGSRLVAIPKGNVELGGRPDRRPELRLRSTLRPGDIHRIRLLAVGTSGVESVAGCKEVLNAG